MPQASGEPGTNLFEVNSYEGLEVNLFTASGDHRQTSIAKLIVQLVWRKNAP